MRRILITGAGSGLGEALAKKYAGSGAEICVADVNPQGGTAVVQEVHNQGGEAFFIKCDITQQSDVDKLVMT
ncbi:MAG: SDR family NAD(P)-dependent oxidoreductase, partial [Arenicella sp.]|nr:SDR family NAD(P)-dependent oxidoreductase [Arenicella sp.]